MLVDRSWAHVENLTNLAIGLSVGDPQHHIRFASGQSERFTQTLGGVAVLLAIDQSEQVFLRRDLREEFDVENALTSMFDGQMVAWLGSVSQPGRHICSKSRKG